MAKINHCKRSLFYQTISDNIKIIMFNGREQNADSHFILFNDNSLEKVLPNVLFTVKLPIKARLIYLTLHLRKK